jgi:hypothetical protein
VPEVFIHRSDLFPAESDSDREGTASNVTPQTDPLALQFLEKPIMI